MSRKNGTKVASDHGPEYVRRRSVERGAGVRMPRRGFAAVINFREAYLLHMKPHEFSV